RRYEFHLQVQKLFKNLRDGRASALATCAYLRETGRSRHEDHIYYAMLDGLRYAHKALKETVNAAKELSMPPLQNVTAGGPLKPYLLDEPLVEGITEYDWFFESEWVNEMVNQLEDVFRRLTR